MTITDDILPKAAVTLDFEFKSGKKSSVMAMVMGDDKKGEYRVFLRNQETHEISSDEEMVTRSEYGVADKISQQDCWSSLLEAKAKMHEIANDLEEADKKKQIKILKPAVFFEFKEKSSKFAVASEILRIPRLAPFFKMNNEDSKAKGIDPHELLAKIFDIGKSIQDHLKESPKKEIKPDISPLEIQKLDSKLLLKKYTKPQLREMVLRMGLNNLERKHGKKQVEEFTKLINLK